MDEPFTDLIIFCTQVKCESQLHEHEKKTSVNGIQIIFCMVWDNKKTTIYNQIHCDLNITLFRLHCMDKYLNITGSKPCFSSTFNTDYSWRIVIMCSPIMICLIPVIVRSKLKAYIVNQCWLIAARKIVAHSLEIFWQSAYCNFKTRVHRTRSSKFREKSRGCIFYIFVVRQLNQLYMHSQHSCIFISSKILNKWMIWSKE